MGIAIQTNSALKQLDKGNTQATIAKLQSIINQVGNLINAGHISAQDGQTLIAAISAIISQL